MQQPIQKMKVNGIPYEVWKASTQKPKPKVELLPEIWSIVKEFAGVYHIGTTWSVRDVPKLFTLLKIRLKPSERQKLKKVDLMKYKSLENWKKIHTYLAKENRLFDASPYKKGDRMTVTLKYAGRKSLPPIECILYENEPNTKFTVIQARETLTDKQLAKLLSLYPDTIQTPQQMPNYVRCYYDRRIVHKVEVIGSCPPPTRYWADSASQEWKDAWFFNC